MKKKILLLLILVLVACIAMSAGNENIVEVAESIDLANQNTSVHTSVISLSNADAWDKLNKARWENEFWTRYFPIYFVAFLTLIGVLKPRWEIAINLRPFVKTKGFFNILFCVCLLFFLKKSPCLIKRGLLDNNSSSFPGIERPEH